MRNVRSISFAADNRRNRPGKSLFISFSLMPKRKVKAANSMEKLGNKTLVKFYPFARSILENGVLKIYLPFIYGAFIEDVYVRENLVNNFYPVNTQEQVVDSNLRNYYIQIAYSCFNSAYG